MTKQRQVLIVSPHFPPVNAPDHQRVRMSLSHLAEFGWRATVLAVAPEYVEGTEDLMLLRAVPETTRVIRTKALPLRHTRRIGLGGLALRALPFLRKAGDRLLSSEKFDLVFFSTTAFPVMSLGPRWLKRWRVPYVLDFQDPWRSDYFSERTERPPGGRLKYRAAQRIAQLLEPSAIRNASHIITVSTAYRESLLQRYAWLSPDRFTVLPFGAAESDFALLNSLELQQKVFNPRDGKRHWVYVGAGGIAMNFSLRSFFQALGKVRSNGGGQQLENLMIHFVGTDYAAGDRARETCRPIAAEYGVADLVEELPNRIPYFEALKCLTDADALIVPGSDDPGYTASKICAYVLANKPMLAIFHEDSSVVEIMRSANVGTVVTFKDKTQIERMTSEIQARWFKSLPQAPLTINRTALEPYLAKEMTYRQCAIFDRCVEQRRGAQSTR